MADTEGFLPLEAKAAAQAPAKRKKGKAKPAAEEEDGPSTSGAASRVVYIGNLPHGFYEQQLLGYFSQFGKLTKVRLSRNKKTGKSKHYAFMEFQHPEVATIAAETMNGYFMFKQRLTCKVLPPEKIHPELFKGANRKFRAKPWKRMERERHDKERTPEEHALRVQRALRRDAHRAKRIQAAGIDYTYDGLQDVAQKQGRLRPQKVKLDDDDE